MAEDKKSIEFSKAELVRLKDAIDLKLKSLKRGQSSSAPSFREVFDQEISGFMAILSRL